MKSIVIHANCRIPFAKGDFDFAGSIAKDLIRQLKNEEIDDIDVILVSDNDGKKRFIGLYGKLVNDRISIEGISVGLSSLQEFDAVKNIVIAFIDANRCKYSSGDLVKRILSPESRFLFIGHVTQPSYYDLGLQASYRMNVKKQQQGLYDSFNEEDMWIGSAGFGVERLGLPTFTKVEDLAELSDVEKINLPQGAYGFIYIAEVEPPKDFKLIAQYLKLSGHDKYVLVGDIEHDTNKIQRAYDRDLTFSTSKKLLLEMEYYHFLPKRIMRETIAKTAGSLVLSTGTSSTLEAMIDNKLSYYQDMSFNAEFVTSFLIAVKSLVMSDRTLSGNMPEMIIELSNLLFANKPLNSENMQRTHQLLNDSSVSTNLIHVNKKVIEKANGKIAPRLLGFLGKVRKTKDSEQLAIVCATLRLPGEIESPIHDEALRRAAAWGCLFELKVLIKSMSILQLNKESQNHQRTALHDAAEYNQLDSAKLLIDAGADLNIHDKNGQTPLHIAVKNDYREMMDMLKDAGAFIDISDKGLYHEANLV